MNSAVHRAKADESPKNQLILNSSFARRRQSLPLLCLVWFSNFRGPNFPDPTFRALPHFREFPEQSRRCRHQQPH